MSNLDLNIENYTIDDLVSFFRLSSIFTESDVLKKESEIRTILLSSGHIAPHFKRDLIIFLEEGKKRIIENRITKTTPSVIYKNPTTIPDNFTCVFWISWSRCRLKTMFSREDNSTTT